ncbi:MAG: TetR/AcrR family transcriptional regulator [Methylococcales bacterium]
MNSKEKILTAAIILFAQKGYSGLSMRQLALSVDLSVAAIYHHFPDKNALYLEAVRFSFSDKEQVFDQVWNSDCSANEKLHGFIRSLIDVMLNDQNFHRLMQREILEANPERMQLLAKGVFHSQFCLLMQLMAELAPEQDAHLFATSAIGLAKYYIEYQPLLKNLPGWKLEHEIPEFMASHITSLLLNSF